MNLTLTNQEGMLLDFLRVMPNEIIWIIFALVNFGLITLFYKFFGKTGLFVWIAFGTVLANIQVTKQIELFGMVATLGNIMYGTIFLATDAFNDLYGPKEAKKAVWIGFFTLISTVIIMQMAVAFHELSNDPTVAEFQFSMLKIFGFMPRIALGSLVAYLISQHLDVYLFTRIKGKFGSKRQLWIRNNGSTLVSQLIDSLIFVVIAFIGVVESLIFWEILFTTYVVKLIVAVLDTPFVYLIQKIKPIYAE